MIYRILFVPLALGSLVTACGGAPSAAATRDQDAPEPRVVQLATATIIPISRSVVVSGTLAADEQVMLSLKVTGRLEELLVDLGSPVREGQVVARLAATDFELRRQQATAALQQARARLGLPPDGEDDTIDIESTGLVRQAEAVLNEARLSRSRVATFVERGISARADLDTADAQLQIAEARHQDAIEEVRNRQALLAQRRSELALAVQQVADTELRSPIDGVVRERHAFAGEYRSAGTPVVTVVRQHPLRLQLAVPERAALDIRVGQTVRVQIEGDDRVHEGRVARLSPAITEGNRTLPLEAEVPNPTGELRPGTFARAEIVTSEATGLVIPQSALVTFAGVEKVLVVEDGVARERHVRTGQRLGERLEILEGLVAGDAVVVNPGNLSDGAPVTTAP